MAQDDDILTPCMVQEKEPQIKDEEKTFVNQDGPLVQDQSMDQVED